MSMSHEGEIKRLKALNLLHALQKARDMIAIFHGEEAWPRIRETADMKQINSAVEKGNKEMSTKPSTYVRDKTHNKQKEVTAASFKRIAKALRAKARKLRRMARAEAKAQESRFHDLLYTRALALEDMSVELDVEAKTLRAMR